MLHPTKIIQPAMAPCVRRDTLSMLAEVPVVGLIITSGNKRRCRLAAKKLAMAPGQRQNTSKKPNDVKVAMSGHNTDQYNT